jgi:hypothetical protein
MEEKLYLTRMKQKEKELRDGTDFDGDALENEDFGKCRLNSRELKQKAKHSNAHFH